MIIIGVDFHPEFQQIASVDTETGEFQEKRLGHREEAETFYRELAAAGQKMRFFAKYLPAATTPAGSTNAGAGTFDLT